MEIVSDSEAMTEQRSRWSAQNGLLNAHAPSLWELLLRNRNPKVGKSRGMATQGEEAFEQLEGHRIVAS